MKTKKLFLYTTLSVALIMGCKKNEVDPTVDTEVSGEVSGTWAKGGTYRITNDLYIPEGKSLTIEEGVTVLFSDTTIKPEVIIKGNLYCLGTSANPVKFTVSDELKAAKPFGQLWGGLIAGPKAAEIVIQHTVLEYGGATTTESSASVKAGLYKATAGENVPVMYVSNLDGKVVFTNNTVRHFAEDGLYMEGGKLIIAYNTFYTTGISGGDAVNIKSGVLADVAFNLFYSPNTNALKLSNTDDRSPQAYVIAYNNTMVNAGWRRPSVKGGSVWVEKSVRAEVVNNLFVNDRFGIKRDTKNVEDNRSVFSHNHYYGYGQACVNQFQTTLSGIVGGSDDIRGTVAGENDPKLVTFEVSNDTSGYTFNESWDFHLQTGAPGLNKGTTTVAGQFSTGLVVNGVTYTSPSAATYIGAFGTK